MTLEPIYQHICPVCGGEASSKEIEIYGMCSRCALDDTRMYTLNALSFMETANMELEEFSRFFQKVTGYKPWGSQKIWARRLLSGENAGIIAPTGIGKTTLLIVYALYMYSRRKAKILFLAPTTSLAKQITNKITMYSEKLSRKPRILFYDSGKSRKKREEILRSIENDEYDILVVTNAFLARKRSLFKNKRFDLVIVDDVDSMLSSSKNISVILNMLGYTNDAIHIARNLVNMRMKILFLRANNSDEKKLAEMLRQYIELERQLKEKILSNTHGQIIIASATGRARGVYAAVMRELLNLDVSGITIYGRDVTDAYLLLEKTSEITGTILSLVKKLGPGGIILVSSRHPLHEHVSIRKLAATLTSHGIVAREATPAAIRKLIQGEIDVVVGTASYYGVSVRGIDAPERIKYVIFIGTPAFKLNIDKMLTNIRFLHRILLYLKENNINVNLYLKATYKALKILSLNEIRILSYLLQGILSIEDITNTKVINIYNEISSIIPQIKNIIISILDKNNIIKLGTLVLYRYNNKYMVLIPDIMTYIQASGRTSRLYRGRMTHGISIIIEHEELKGLIDAFTSRLRFLKKDFSVSMLTDELLGKALEKAVESRRRGVKTELRFRTALLVVESPTKARTISSFFGKPARRRIGSITVYETPFIHNDTIIYLNVLATRGHIYDLTTEPGRGVHGIEFTGTDIRPIYTTIKRCRVCGHQFTYGDRCPRCGSSDYFDSIEIISALRKLASEADEILISTDPDSEGEKIAYDIYNVVKPFNKNIYRIELHEITLTEFIKAYSNRRNIYKPMVYAQIYRRTLDRLIGFSLSQHLWSVFNKNWLGAGRVQTPVLGWIIDNYDKWRRNRGYILVLYIGPGEPYYRLTLFIEDKEEARRIKDSVASRGHVDFEVVRVSEKTYNPPPPLTTDELLYEAGKIGIPANTTMKIAQQLFEAGLITYHRTDSRYVSDEGIRIAAKYLEEHAARELFYPRHWGTPGTHEAIRPTQPWSRNDLEKAVAEGALSTIIHLTPLHLRIYDIVFKRFMASQMRPYKGIEYTVRFTVSEGLCQEATLLARITMDGWNTIDNTRRYRWIEELDGYAPVREALLVRGSRIRLYTQSDVVKMMKEHGLGRPSTYASILGSLRRHGYVIESKKRHYLIPTRIGIEVYNELAAKFAPLVSEETTREMEKTIDAIQQGSVDAHEAIMNLLNTLNSYGLVDTTAYLQATEDARAFA